MLAGHEVQISEADFLTKVLPAGPCRFDGGTALPCSPVLVDPEQEAESAESADSTDHPRCT